MDLQLMSLLCQLLSPRLFWSSNHVFYEFGGILCHLRTYSVVTEGFIA